MPFAGYEDFDACVADNQDKQNPEAYCAAIEQAAKDAETADAASENSTETGTFSSPMRFELVPVIRQVQIGYDDPDDDDDDMDDFHAVMIVEGAWTGDGRYIEEGALGWRDLPLPLMALDRTTEGHMDAVLVGNFTKVERMGREVHGYGKFVQSDAPEVQRLQALIRSGELRGISADLDSMEYEVLLPAEVDDSVRIEADGTQVVKMSDARMRITSARVMGATVVPFPAFQEAYIESVALTAALLDGYDGTGWLETFDSIADMDFTPPKGAQDEAKRGLDWRAEYGRGGTEVGVARARDLSNGRRLSPDTVRRMLNYFTRHEVDKQGQGFKPGEDGYPSAGRIAWALWGGDPGFAWARQMVRSMNARQERGSIIASGHPIQPPVCPPAAWFSDPGFTGETPVTVTDEGRILGHVATWATCHVGFPSECVTPPRTGTGYSHYLVGEILCDDGSRHPVGKVTMSTGHAPLRNNAARAAAHYDDTGTAIADVTVGEDAWGIWMSGAVRPDATPEQIRSLMASPPSGDWRRIGTTLEMIAVLAVNTPGFPTPRVREAEGMVASLVAGAQIERDESTLAAAAERIASTIGRSKSQRIESLKTRVHDKKG
jgi:hypothetical protein